MLSSAGFWHYPTVLYHNFLPIDFQHFTVVSKQPMAWLESRINEPRNGADRRSSFLCSLQVVANAYASLCGVNPNK